MADLAQTRRKNYSIDHEEHAAGMIALAVSVGNDKVKLYCTVSFHTPISRMNLDEAIQYLPRLHLATTDLAQLAEE